MMRGGVYFGSALFLVLIAVSAASLKFKCGSEECIDEGDICDGFNDCEDNSDEKDCPDSDEMNTHDTQPNNCPVGKWQCAEDVCINDILRCDGKQDCYNNSDEEDCLCAKGQFQCRDNTCIEGHLKCNRREECGDGSDEEGCSYEPETPAPPTSPPVCLSGQFTCSRVFQCVSQSDTCNGIPDCTDRSDEENCAPVNIKISSQPMVTLNIGDVLVVNCTAIGVPTPEINWRLNLGHIPAKCTTTSVDGFSTLTCPDIQPEDQGAYSCEGRNIRNFVLAVSDSSVIVNHVPNICSNGMFNSAASKQEECISCFCFGVATKCHSAELFAYQLPPPFHQYKIFTVETSPAIRICDDVVGQVPHAQFFERDGVRVTLLSGDNSNPNNVPYYALSENYHGNQLKSYGGYLKYTVQHSGNGTPNAAPSVILSGNNEVLWHKGEAVQPHYETEVSVRFFYGEWYKKEGRTLATREEIMMALANVDNILIKTKYDDGSVLDTAIIDIIMDTTDTRNTGLSAASFVEECQCPAGYTGLSCENCANGYVRRESGPWLGQCYREEPVICQPGYYGDPERNITCQLCPCPLTNPPNQDLDTYSAHTSPFHHGGQPTCNCPAAYVGRRCEQCAAGYQGNPLIHGDSCSPVQECDPDGSFSPNVDPSTGQCRCKHYATGSTCNECKANTFNLAFKNQFGCISCFCMGVTTNCVSSNWYRNKIQVSFTSSIRDFTLVELKEPNIPTEVEGILLDAVNREIINRSFSNSTSNDVYYWQLPNDFLGNQIASYGGNLEYTVRYVPPPSGQSSRNNATDIQLISSNDIILLYYSRDSPQPNSQQEFTVPLLEQYWQRNDGTQADREQLLMALADVSDIRIKATYTTHTDEAALSRVSLDTAEISNTGHERAVEIEQCFCPIGYKGLSCEDCDVGYTRADSLYLGLCEPCFCNGHSSQCHPETGICENCTNNTAGNNCEKCNDGYELDDLGVCRQTAPGPSSLTKCTCPEKGLRACIDGICEYKTNVYGSECEDCRSSTLGSSKENLFGHNECFCSGVTNECQESSLYIHPIPYSVNQSQTEFTLTDSTRREVIDQDFIVNVTKNEIGYRYPDNRNQTLFWSLPVNFTGNMLKSYGGKLNITQQITTHPNADSFKNQDVVLFGNRITLYWSNPKQLEPGIPLTYSVNLREYNWTRLISEGYRTASRTELMTVLANLEAILIRATHSKGMIGTYISNISLETAVPLETTYGRATQVEVCRCPPGYNGTSCEICSPGYYRDTYDHLEKPLGSCNKCPCNDREHSCALGKSGVECHCRAGYNGKRCEKTENSKSFPGPQITPYEWKGSIGETVRLRCSALQQSGRVAWTRFDKSPLQPTASDRSGVLEIYNTTVRDSGLYICTEISIIGTQTTTTGRVTINSHRGSPVVNIVPGIQKVSRGTDAELNCVVSGDPTAQVEWKKQGREPLESNVQFVGNSLRIVNAQMSNRGIYICYVNGESRAQASAIVEVDRREIPVVKIFPNLIQTALINGSAMIQCRTKQGIPLPVLRWSRQGGRRLSNNIEELPGGVLRFNHVTADDGGTFICTGTNEVEPSSVTAQLDIQSPPVIRIAPWTGDGIIRVKNGERVQLTCSATGIPQPFVAWSKYENKLPVIKHEFNGVKDIPQNAVHEISSVSESDEGSYSCQARNAAGLIEERIHIIVEDNEILTDTQQPPPSNIPDDILRIPDGGRVEMRCRVAGPDQEKIYLDWKRSDQRNLPRESEVKNGMLIIPNVNREAAGEYICVGSNHSGSILFQAKSRLIIIFPPRITLNPPIQNVAAGDNSSITCIATGEEPIQIEWYAIGRPLPRSISHNQGFLQFRGITSHDAGKYACKATNVYGTASSVAEVSVDDPSMSTPHPVREVSTYVGKTVRLQCKLDQNANIDWYKDNGNVPENAYKSNNTLELRAVKSEDSGKYSCEIKTASGVTRDYTTLTITPAPSPVVVKIKSYPKDVIIGGTLLRCIVSGATNSRFYWSRHGQKSLPENAEPREDVLLLRNVTLNQTGYYQCRVNSSEGTFTDDYYLEIEDSDNTPDPLAVETKSAPFGSNVNMDCNVRLQQPNTFVWSRLGGELPRSSKTSDSRLMLFDVRAKDAGTYICLASDGRDKIQGLTVLVVTGIVPNFHQAPESYIVLPKISKGYLKFDIEVSFKPENHDGVILYNGGKNDGTGDFLALSLVGGYPEFRFDAGGGPAIIRANRTIRIGEWHTIRIHHSRKEGTMLVDGYGPYKGIGPGRFYGLDLKEPLYVGGVPDYNAVSRKAKVRSGFVGCISRLVLGSHQYDLIADRISSIGVTTCETCAENPCHNGGACQEAATEQGYTCLCPSGYSGKYCDNIGQFCYPGACVGGSCVDKEFDFECICSYGRTGPRCEQSLSISDPAFRDNSFLALNRVGKSTKRGRRRNATKIKPFKSRYARSRRNSNHHYKVHDTNY